MPHHLFAIRRPQLKYVQGTITLKVGPAQERRVVPPARDRSPAARALEAAGRKARGRIRNDLVRGRLLAAQAALRF